VRVFVCHDQPYPPSFLCFPPLASSPFSSPVISASSFSFTDEGLRRLLSRKEPSNNPTPYLGPRSFFFASFLFVFLLLSFCYIFFCTRRLPTCFPSRMEVVTCRFSPLHHSPPPPSAFHTRPLQKSSSFLAFAGNPSLQTVLPPPALKHRFPLVSARGPGRISCPPRLASGVPLLVSLLALSSLPCSRRPGESVPSLRPIAPNRHFFAFLSLHLRPTPFSATC